MLIRPQYPLQTSGQQDAWKLIRVVQESSPTAGWLIPQPAHSALAGEIAAQLSPLQFPGLDDEKILRCIALHDAGWGLFDADQIERSRAPGFLPVSFISEPASVYLRAWTDSINLAEKLSPAGGHMVSRHFESLAKEPDTQDRQQVQQFQTRERQRQQRLAQRSGKSQAQLDVLFHAIRLCDLLSLLLCGNIAAGGSARVRVVCAGAPEGGYDLAQENNEWVFRGVNPMRQGRAEFKFSGVAFGSNRSGGGWFSAAICPTQ